MEVFSPKVGFL